MFLLALAVTWTGAAVVLALGLGAVIRVVERSPLYVPDEWVREHR